MNGDLKKSLKKPEEPFHRLEYPWPGWPLFVRHAGYVVFRQRSGYLEQLYLKYPRFIVSAIQPDPDVLCADPHLVTQPRIAAKG
jgi:hypothetical protein